VAKCGLINRRAGAVFSWCLYASQGMACPSINRAGLARGALQYLKLAQVNNNVINLYLN